jgi:hypothetical protein
LVLGCIVFVRENDNDRSDDRSGKDRDGKDEMCMFCVVFERVHARSGVGMSVSVSVSVGIGVGEVSVGGVEVGVEVGEVWENSIGSSFCTASDCFCIWSQ